MKNGGSFHSYVSLPDGIVLSLRTNMDQPSKVELEAVSQDRLRSVRLAAVHGSWQKTMGDLRPIRSRFNSFQMSDLVGLVPHFISILAFSTWLATNTACSFLCIASPGFDQRSLGNLRRCLVADVQQLGDRPVSNRSANYGLEQVAWLKSQEEFMPLLALIRFSCIFRIVGAWSSQELRFCHMNHACFYDFLWDHVHHVSWLLYPLLFAHAGPHVCSTSEIFRTMPALLRALCLRDVDFAAGVGSACSQHPSHTVI